MIKNLIGFFIVMTAHRYYHRLQPSAEPSLRYKRALDQCYQVLNSQRDLNSHHFQPCHQCGYALALVKDPKYCVSSDQYKLLHPRTVLEDITVFRDYAGPDLARALIQSEFYDAIPSFVQNRPLNYSWNFKLPQETTVIYPYAKNYFRTHQLGTMAGCLFQKYAHVPGQDEIALKTNQSIHFSNYLQMLKNNGKPNHCIEDAKYYKPTYKMWFEPECRALFDILDSDEYQTKLQKEGIQYIFKTNRHLGHGIMVLDTKSELLLRQWYRNGDECGRNRTGVIVQEYVTNPYLYKGHKMEFRAYFAIASTNPPTLYGYKTALLKTCALAFNLTNPTKEGHVCNTAVTKSLNDATENKGETHYIDWNLEELQDILLEEGRIKDKTWLDTQLRPQMYRKVTHLYLSVKDYLFSDSRVGEFFGVDFIMDDNLRLWIFECNRNPNFLAVTEGRMNKFSRLLIDMITLSHLYVKSKFIRIKNFIDKYDIGNVRMDAKLQREFMQLQEDYLEPEFDLPSDSLLQLVYVDSTNKDKYRYKLQIDEVCLVRR